MVGTDNREIAITFSIDPYSQYEYYKALWKSNNPCFTSQQYDAAMLAIAENCGV